MLIKNTFIRLYINKILLLFLSIVILLIFSFALIKFPLTEVSNDLYSINRLEFVIVGTTKDENAHFNVKMLLYVFNKDHNGVNRTIDDKNYIAEEYGRKIVMYTVKEYFSNLSYDYLLQNEILIENSISEIIINNTPDNTIAGVKFTKYDVTKK